MNKYLHAFGFLFEFLPNFLLRTSLIIVLEYLQVILLRETLKMPLIVYNHLKFISIKKHKFFFKEIKFLLYSQLSLF